MFKVPKAELLPPKIVIHGEPGWGKTTMAVYAQKPFIIMDSLERGYLTLLGAGQVPAEPCAVVSTTEEIFAAVRAAVADKDCKTIVFDTIGGIVSLIVKEIINGQFDGNVRKYRSYGTGPDYVVGRVTEMLVLLEAAQKTVVMVGHSTIRTKQNPAGDDYDQHMITIEKKVRPLIEQWADAVYFGSFDAVIDPNTEKPIGDYERVLKCAPHPAYQAKKRYSNQPSEITMDCGPQQMWAKLMANIVNKKEDK